MFVFINDMKFEVKDFGQDIVWNVILSVYHYEHAAGLETVEVGEVVDSDGEVLFTKRGMELLMA
jgi:hypothetical protein